jgi:hypothetical protein
MNNLDNTTMRDGWTEAAGRDPIRERIDELFDHHDDSTAGIYFDAIEAVLQLCDDWAADPRAVPSPAALVREAIGVALSVDPDG